MQQYSTESTILVQFSGVELHKMEMLKYCI